MRNGSVAILGAWLAACGAAGADECLSIQPIDLAEESGWVLNNSCDYAVAVRWCASGPDITIDDAAALPVSQVLRIVLPMPARRRQAQGLSLCSGAGCLPPEPGCAE
jgi:hypothetical protein